MDVRLHAFPLTTAIVEHLEQQAKAKRWKPSTELKVAATVAGALRQLPLYRAGSHSLELARCPIWRAAMLALARRVRKTIPQQPVAAQKEQVFLAIARETNSMVRAGLMMTWIAAARTSDIARLQKQDVAWHDTALQITFRESKTAATVGARSVTCSVPAAWQEEIALFLTAAARPSTPLFPEMKQFSAFIRLALRRVDPRLESRSLRRGGLQTMALAGTPVSTLLVFSGHSSERTLRTYLAWGAKLAVATNATRQAGQLLC
jgi:integrase